MSAFNDVNGVPCSGNKFLLRDVLRDKLGFEGFVVSDAMVYIWHGGVAAGEAVANVLTGRHNPSGHLTVSFPRKTGQVPVYYNHYSTGRPALGKVPYEAKYYDCEIGALYPFGYGLSYTNFEYSDLHLSDSKMGKDGMITVRATVKNTGEYDGYDVVQLYVRDLVGSRVRPVAELKGYMKLFLKKGESTEVEFSLYARNLAFTNENMEKVTEPGEFKLWWHMILPIRRMKLILRLRSKIRR